jgi:hypothetical protein
MSKQPLPKEKARSFCCRASERLPLGYHLLALVQAPFGYVFWFLEQRKARFEDHMGNERSGHE